MIKRVHQNWVSAGFTKQSQHAPRLGVGRNASVLGRADPPGRPRASQRLAPTKDAMGSFTLIEMPALSDRKRSAFTLIEMLVVIAIVAILVTALFPAMNAAFRNARRGRAQHEIAGLIAAIKSYHSEFGKWPCPDNGVADQTFYAAGSNAAAADAQAQVLNCLTNNPSKMVFLEVTANSLTDGFYLDPWGNPYVITLDTDFDNKCKVQSIGAGSFIGTVSNKGVCVWSWGDAPGEERSIIKSW